MSIVVFLRRFRSMSITALLSMALTAGTAMAQTITAPPSTTIPEFAVPAWVDQQIGETKARFDAWRGDDEVMVFPIITDIHAARPLLHAARFPRHQVQRALRPARAMAFKPTSPELAT